MTDAWDGRPQNPERDGWHAIGWIGGVPANTYVVLWSPDHKRLRDKTEAPCPGYLFGGDAGFMSPKMAARHYRYLGPCLLSEEITAREAASSEAMREACVAVVQEWAADAVLGANTRGVLEVLARALNDPNVVSRHAHASALARAEKAAEKRGMEKAARIAEGWSINHSPKRLAAAIRNAAAQEIVHDPR